MREGYRRILIYFTSRRQGTAFQYYRMIRLRYILYCRCPNLRFSPLLNEKKRQLSFPSPLIMQAQQKVNTSQSMSYFIRYVVY